MENQGKNASPEQKNVQGQGGLRKGKKRPFVFTRKSSRTYIIWLPDWIERFFEKRRRS